MNEIETNDLEFTCRYDFFGAPNGCRGLCEGTGFIPYAVYLGPPKEGDGRPVDDPDDPPILRVLWFLLEARNPLQGTQFEHDDPWHFVPCPDCRVDDPLIRLARRFMGGKPADRETF